MDGKQRSSGMRSRGTYVSPLSRAQIQNATVRVHALLEQLDRTRVAGSKIVDICHILELMLPKYMDGFNFIVADDAELGDDKGQTRPDRLEIAVKNSVYVGACRGNGHDRFTLAHEFAHLVLHQGQFSFARGKQPEAWPSFHDSEWQADEFAGQFLMPRTEISLGATPIEVAEEFGVSLRAADVRLSILRSNRG